VCLAGILDLNLCVSFCREIALLFGLCSVSKPTLLARLRQGPGSAILLAVGGAAESLLTQVGTCR
jgi:2-acylglycerol O-acyltransferase 2